MTEDGYEIAIGPGGGVRETYNFALPIPGESDADKLLRLWFTTYRRMKRENPGLVSELGDNLDTLTFLHLRSAREAASGEGV